MEPLELNLRCTSCPDGELMVVGQYVYCSFCDPRPGHRGAVREPEPTR